MVSVLTQGASVESPANANRAICWLKQRAQSSATNWELVCHARHRDGGSRCLPMGEAVGSFSALGRTMVSEFGIGGRGLGTNIGGDVGRVPQSPQDFSICFSRRSAGESRFQLRLQSRVRADQQRQRSGTRLTKSAGASAMTSSRAGTRSCEGLSTARVRCLADRLLHRRG